MNPHSPTWSLGPRSAPFCQRPPSTRDAEAARDPAAAGEYAALCQEKTSGQGGGWEGVYILSYDPTARQYHVHGTERPGSSLHAIGRIEADRWTRAADPAPDGSRLRHTLAPATQGARTLVAEAGTGDGWATIVNIKYGLRK